MIENAVLHITQKISRTLNISRVGIWLFSEDRKFFTCVDQYLKSEDQHYSGSRLPVVNYPTYFKALEQGRYIDAHDACDDPRTVEFKTGYLVPLGIVSMLDSPIRKDGHLIGAVCLEQIGESRIWQDDEIAFASSVADLLTTALSNQERQIAETKQRGSASALI